MKTVTIPHWYVDIGYDSGALTVATKAFLPAYQEVIPSNNPEFGVFDYFKWDDPADRILSTSTSTGLYWAVRYVETDSEEDTHKLYCIDPTG
jgi:hypothetical protein